MDHQISEWYLFVILYSRVFVTDGKYGHRILYKNALKVFKKWIWLFLRTYPPPTTPSLPPAEGSCRKWLLCIPADPAACTNQLGPCFSCGPYVYILQFDLTLLGPPSAAVITLKNYIYLESSTLHYQGKNPSQMLEGNYYTIYLIHPYYMCYSILGS